ncbi:endoribonuclease l-psp [Fusarium longipes]|uniref:Endoribonuclease l-psp n=1 Tax=Fusarium longipes TaxID=694270 RepID=A0A395T3Z7_9HYPO|nr:endoribonuclease l-psp [Fusarium longipes]
MSSYREPVFTKDACAPLPQFSQAVKYNGMVYCSGAIGIDPKTNDLVSGTTTDRARVALQNLKAVLEAAGSGMERIVKANIFLTDMKNFAALNVAWDEFFPEDPKPCRTCVAVHQLPLGTDVEIEAIASYD